MRNRSQERSRRVIWTRYSRPSSGYLVKTLCDCPTQPCFCRALTSKQLCGAVSTCGKDSKQKRQTVPRPAFPTPIVPFPVPDLYTTSSQPKTLLLLLLLSRCSVWRRPKSRVFLPHLYPSKVGKEGVSLRVRISYAGLDAFRDIIHCATSA